MRPCWRVVALLVALAPPVWAQQAALDIRNPETSGSVAVPPATPSVTVRLQGWHCLPADADAVAAELARDTLLSSDLDLEIARARFFRSATETPPDPGNSRTVDYANCWSTADFDAVLGYVVRVAKGETPADAAADSTAPAPSAPAPNPTAPDRTATTPGPSSPPPRATGGVLPPILTTPDPTRSGPPPAQDDADDDDALGAILRGFAGIAATPAPTTPADARLDARLDQLLREQAANEQAIGQLMRGTAPGGAAVNAEAAPGDFGIGRVLDDTLGRFEAAAAGFQQNFLGVTNAARELNDLIARRDTELVRAQKTDTAIGLVQIAGGLVKFGVGIFTRRGATAAAGLADEAGQVVSEGERILAEGVEGAAVRGTGQVAGAAGDAAAVLGADEVFAIQDATGFVLGEVRGTEVVKELVDSGLREAAERLGINVEQAILPVIDEAGARALTDRLSKPVISSFALNEALATAVAEGLGLHQALPGAAEVALNDIIFKVFRAAQTGANAADIASEAETLVQVARQLGFNTTDDLLNFAGRAFGGTGEGGIELLFTGETLEIVRAALAGQGSINTVKRALGPVRAAALESAIAAGAAGNDALRREILKLGKEGVLESLPDSEVLDAAGRGTGTGPANDILERILRENPELARFGGVEESLERFEALRRINALAGNSQGLDNRGIAIFFRDLLASGFLSPVETLTDLKFSSDALDAFGRLADGQQERIEGLARDFREARFALDRLRGALQSFGVGQLDSDIGDRIDTIDRQLRDLDLIELESTPGFRDRTADARAELRRQLEQQKRDLGLLDARLRAILREVERAIAELDAAAIGPDGQRRSGLDFFDPQVLVKLGLIARRLDALGIAALTGQLGPVISGTEGAAGTGNPAIAEPGRAVGEVMTGDIVDSGEITTPGSRTGPFGFELPPLVLPAPTTVQATIATRAIFLVQPLDGAALEPVLVCPGDTCFEIRAVSLDAIRAITGFNAFDSAQVQRLEEVQALRNPNGDAVDQGGNGNGGNGNGGGGDVDLATLIPGGTFIAADGNGEYVVSIECFAGNAAPGVNNGVLLDNVFDFGFENIFGRGNEIFPLATFVGLNGVRDIVSFADNTVTAFVATDIRNNDLVATGAVAANSTGVIFDITCQGPVD